MPLQPCRDCGHEVSSEAVACPRCAAPIRPVKPVRQSGEGAFLKTLNCGCIVALIFAAAVIIAVAAQM
jgi:hypothetical protein